MDTIAADPIDDRPNLLAVASVLVGSLGLMSYVCFYPIFLAGLFGLVGLVLAALGRRQAARGAPGRDYVWWGTAMGLGHLALGTMVGVAIVMSVLS